MKSRPAPGDKRPVVGAPVTNEPDECPTCKRAWSYWDGEGNRRTVLLKTVDAQNGHVLSFKCPYCRSVWQRRFAPWSP